MEPDAAPDRRIPSRDLAGVVLAAGAGSRLAPLTDVLPKALCPVGNRALVDLALDRLATVAGSMAVNAHHHADLLVRHLERGWGSGVTVSVEHAEPLGTAGAIAALRDWIDGRPVIVVNADAWSPTSLEPLVREWDGSSARVLIHGAGGFGPRASIVASVLPWSIASTLSTRPSGLYEVVWRAAFERGELEVVVHDGPFIDCGNPADYLRANLTAVDLHGSSIIAPDADIDDGVRIARSVIGPRARVRSDMVESVVWADQSVPAGGRLLRSIRAGSSVTVGPVESE